MKLHFRLLLSRNIAFKTLSLRQIRRRQEKIKAKRARSQIPRANYAESTWGRMLQDPRIQDPDSREGKLFRRRYVSVMSYLIIASCTLLVLYT